MLRLFAGMMLAAMAFARVAAAQEMDPDSPLGQAIGKDPDRFVAQVTDLIAGFGGPQGLTPQGIADHIALDRAKARALALRQMLAMDLDADGSVTLAELAVAQRAANVSARGRMERQFLAGDANSDGRIDAGEMAMAGQAAALRRLGDDEAEALRGLMTLDRDGNGALTSTEVADALLLVDEAT